MVFYSFDPALGLLGKLESCMGLENFPTYRQDGAGKPDVPFLPLFVGFLLLVYVLETYLDFRQHRRLHATTPPALLLDVLKTLDEETVSKVGFFSAAGGMQAFFGNTDLCY